MKYAASLPPREARERVVTDAMLDRDPVAYAQWLEDTTILQEQVRLRWLARVNSAHEWPLPTPKRQPEWQAQGREDGKASLFTPIRGDHWYATHNAEPANKGQKREGRAA